jgi:hypothetical protein
VIDFKNIRRKAIRYARSKGWNYQTSEDFSQEYCLAIWLEKSPSLKIQLVNFLRIEYGRTDKWGAEQDKARSEAMLTMKCFDDIENFVQSQIPQPDAFIEKIEIIEEDRWVIRYSRT